MLSAFTARSIVELKQRDKSKIESILAYGDRLLVGLNTGSLRIYRVNDIPDDPADQNGTVDSTEGRPTSQPKPRATELLREQEKFSRYKIEQLAIIKEANILISLSNACVSIHDLQSYELQEQLTRTKGASAFAVMSNIVKDPSTGIPSIVSRLGVAVKRKLLLWSWQDMELEQDTAEITLVSGIKTLTWATGTKLVAGLSSSYVLVNVESQEVTDIVGPGSIGGAPGQDSGRLGGVGVASMNYMGMGAMIPKPLATRLSEGHMLLAKDINTHFIDTDGNSLGRRQVPWHTAPEAVGYSYPYLLALAESSKGTLEVRNPETVSLLQSISLPNASLLQVVQPNISLAHTGKGFLVASERCIWRMGALDYDSQIDALVEKEYLDEAISLLGMLEDALLKDKEGRLREIKMQKAQNLFNRGRYRDSLDLFTEVSAPPERVIRLYPKLIAGDLSSAVQHEEAEAAVEGDGEAPTVAAASDKQDSGAHKSKRRSQEAPDPASVKALKKAQTDESSETISVRRKLSETVSTNPPLDGKDLKPAVRELQAFLADVRRRIQRFLNPDGSLKDSTDFQSNDNTKSSSRAINELLGLSLDDEDSDQAQRLRETAKLVDTTLFRAHMYATPSLAGSLFRIANFCDPEVVMEKLAETGRYNDLIDFLFGKKLHRPALERLKDFGQAEKEEENATQLHGPKRTIAYLQNLPPEMIDLILEFAEWPIRTDPNLGMEIFLADTENAETLPRQKVLGFLHKIDVKLAVRYLEHVIDELNDLTPDLHQRLLQLYLERLKRRKEVSEEFKSEEERTEWRNKFLKMLKDSSQYSPAKMLGQLPRDDPEFYEARAIVFSKMGQHRQALEIYVFKLQEPQKAEEYCNRIYLAEDTIASEVAPSRRVSTTDPEDAQPSIYHTLLSLYLSPPPGYKPQWGPAIEILARHGSRLPASSSLDLIPETLPVKELEFYFRGRIRSANSIVNEGRIVAGLQKVQNVATEAKLLLGDGMVAGQGGRSRRVMVNEERVCGVCHKRLGGSVISVFPDNTVVHLGCASRR